MHVLIVSDVPQTTSTPPVNTSATNTTQVNTSDPLSEAVVEGFTDLLTVLVTPIEGFIENNVHSLLQLLVSTPHPETVFGTPQTRPWNALHAYYWETIIPLALLLFGLTLGIIILLESTSHLFSGFHRTHLTRRAFVGLVGVLSWWWIAAFSLQLTDELARFILPDLSSISLFQTLSVSSIGLLGLVLSLSVDLALFLLIALIYLVRQLVLYGFVLGMPLLITCWIPGVGPFQFTARFAQRLAGFYVPFLFMIVPVALLFRLGALLGSSAALSLGGVGQWLTALVIPVVAVVSPFLLIWQAGGVFSVTNSMARHASRTRARERLTRVATHGTTAVTAGGTVARGLTDTSAITSDTQQRGVTSGGSHGRGQGFRSTVSSLRQRVTSKTVQTESPDADASDRTSTEPTVDDHSANLTSEPTETAVSLEADRTWQRDVRGAGSTWATASSLFDSTRHGDADDTGESASETEWDDVADEPLRTDRAHRDDTQDPIQDRTTTDDETDAASEDDHE